MDNEEVLNGRVDSQKEPTSLSRVEDLSKHFKDNQVLKAITFKEQGNIFFKEHNYQKALGNYHKVFTHVNGLQSKDDEYFQYAKENVKIKVEQKDVISDLKQATFLNMSQIYINQGKFDKGLLAAKNALALKQTLKGLFRMGICNFNLDNLMDARDQFKKVQDQDQTMQDEVKNWLKKIDQREAIADKNLAIAMKKMFVKD